LNTSADEGPYIVQSFTARQGANLSRFCKGIGLIENAKLVLGGESVPKLFSGTSGSGAELTK